MCVDGEEEAEAYVAVVLESVLEFGYILQVFVAGGCSACVAGAGEGGDGRRGGRISSCSSGRVACVSARHGRELRAC
jgi:hypothetical protein